MSGFIKESHELVKIHDEVFLHTIRPVVFLKQLLDVFGFHLLKQVIKRVVTDESELDALHKVSKSDRNVPLVLDEENNLEVLGQNVLTVEFRWLIITNSKHAAIIKVSPEEQHSLVGVTEELIQRVVVLFLPEIRDRIVVAELLEVLRDMLDHMFHALIIRVVDFFFSGFTVHTSIIHFA